MARYATVTITRLVKKVDLRCIHKYRNRYRRQLRTGEAVLLLNTAEDKCRLIDSAGGVHNYYADPGDVFDVKAIGGKLGALRLTLDYAEKVATPIGWAKAA